MKKTIRFILKTLITVVLLPIATLVTMFMVARRIIFGKENKIVENLKNYYEEKKGNRTQ
tara:strand:+ start:728 stop:904 length:177 start_codon:yes stop_codon:yes gene_type:complete